MKRYTYTSQRELRRTFRQMFPELCYTRRRDGSFPVDTRVTFVDWIDTLNRNGEISDILAFRATL